MKCKAVTQAGERCKRNAIDGADYCRSHINVALPDVPETAISPANDVLPDPANAQVALYDVRAATSRLEEFLRIQHDYRRPAHRRTITLRDPFVVKEHDLNRLSEIVKKDLERLGAPPQIKVEVAHSGASATYRTLDELYKYTQRRPLRLSLRWEQVQSSPPSRNFVEIVFCVEGNDGTPRVAIEVGVSDREVCIVAAEDLKDYVSANTQLPPLYAWARFLRRPWWLRVLSIVTGLSLSLLTAPIPYNYFREWKESIDVPEVQYGSVWWNDTTLDPSYSDEQIAERDRYRNESIEGLEALRDSITRHDNARDVIVAAVEYYFARRIVETRLEGDADHRQKAQAEANVKKAVEQKERRRLEDLNRAAVLELHLLKSRQRDTLEAFSFLMALLVFAITIRTSLAVVPRIVRQIILHSGICIGAEAKQWSDRENTYRIIMTTVVLSGLLLPLVRALLMYLWG